MSRQRDRDEFIAILTREGVALPVIQALLRAEKTLHRHAELACSSEAYDRDRVPCPRDRVPYLHGGCLCEAAGSKDGDEHGTVPRGEVSEARLQRRIQQITQQAGLSVQFNGDPRGPAILVGVPSGYTNDWSRRGVCVP